MTDNDYNSNNNDKINNNVTHNITSYTDSTFYVFTSRIRHYRVSREEWTKLREGVPYVELHRYNPKHLYPKSNGYGDNGQRILKI